MNNDAKESAAMDTNIIDDVTIDMSKVVVSDNVICGTCTDTSSEQKLEEHTKPDKIGGDASGTADNDISSNSNGEDICGTDICGVCANCGKEGASNTCNKCKLVQYCNAACKKKHKKKHKKACEKRVAELHDIELFKQPPQKGDDCPICFLRLPFLGSGKKYKSCCGQVICSGCMHAMGKNRDLCAFCRVPMPKVEEVVERAQKRVDANDIEAMSFLGECYYNGLYGLARDYTKA